MQNKAFKKDESRNELAFTTGNGVIENEIDNPVRNLASAQNAHI